MVLTKNVLGILEILKIEILSIFLVSVDMGPSGSENFSYYSYKSQPKVFKLVLNFPPNGPHKTVLRIFEILSFRFLSNNVSNNFFSKISNSPLYPMEKAKPQLSGKRAIGRAKRSEL